MRVLIRQSRIVFAFAVTLALGSGISAQQGFWTTKAPMPTPRWGVSADVVDGRIYVVGGASDGGFSMSLVEAYDPQTDTWATKAPIPTPRFWASAAVANGILYVAGGLLYDPYDATLLNTLEAYDPRTNTWSTRAPMLSRRYIMAMGELDGLIYVVGGAIHGEGMTATVEAYDPRTNTWTTKPPMPTPRGHLAVAVAGGRLFAIGGTAMGGVRLATVEAYDPRTNTWTTLPSMPTARTELAAGSIGGLIFVVGGEIDTTTGSRYSTAVEVLDTGSSSWSSAPSISQGRKSLGVGVANEVLYAVGGFGLERAIFAVNEAFNAFLPVSIDIKPGDARNTINLNSAGTVPVAILGSATFDPTSVDPATVTLAGAPVARRGWGVPMTARGDFNHDGYFDLLLHFRTQDLELTPASTEAVLYATTFSGQRLRGADSVRLVFPPGGGHSSTQAAKARKAREP